MCSSDLKDHGGEEWIELNRGVEPVEGIYGDDGGHGAGCVAAHDGDRDSQCRRECGDPEGRRDAHDARGDLHREDGVDVACLSD